MRGKRFSDFEKPELVPQHVHQVGGIAAVEHAEAGVEADRGGVPADQPVGDRVKRAGPGDSGPGSDSGWPGVRS